jgi:spermine oxidase
LNPSKFVDVESKIQLNKQVTNIHWNPDANNEKIVITCEDNSKYEADQVIFTGSLGVLKDRHDKLFTPNLPKEKVEFIENSGYGTLDKIFLEFDKPFWNTEDFNFTYLVWTKSDLDEIMLTEKQWLYNVPGILNVDGFPNLLEFFVTGIFSEKSEEMSDEMVIEHMMWLLKKFYKVDIEKPKRMIRSKWNSSKNFLGSYSYFSIDAELKKLHPSILRKSLKDSSGVNKILFAGEATHHEFSGYTNGGAESGWWAAKEIIDAKN